jgi:hypothetical protein
MVKRRRIPSGGGMALCAGVAVIPQRMIGVGGPIVVTEMTGITIRRQSSAVIPVHMAETAGNRGMSACECESSVRMIECGRLPGTSSVTLSTRVAELIDGVIRSGGSVKVRLMAGVTRGRCVEILPGHVALYTVGGGMSSCQWERRARMIKCGRLPGCRIMALRAGMAELIRRVVRTGCAAVIRLVARIAIRRRAGILSVHMALGARNGSVRSG